jgi:hypothetical protein
MCKTTNESILKFRLVIQDVWCWWFFVDNLDSDFRNKFHKRFRTGNAVKRSNKFIRKVNKFLASENELNTDFKLTIGRVASGRLLDVEIEVYEIFKDVVDK